MFSEFFVEAISSQGRNVFCDKRIFSRNSHSCIIIAFVTIIASVLGFIVVRWFEQIQFGTGNKTVHRRGTPPTSTWYFVVLLMYATSSIVNDFTYHISKCYMSI